MPKDLNSLIQSIVVESASSKKMVIGEPVPYKLSDEENKALNDLCDQLGLPDRLE